MENILREWNNGQLTGDLKCDDPDVFKCFDDINGHSDAIKLSMYWVKIIDDFLFMIANFFVKWFLIIMSVLICNKFFSLAQEQNILRFTESGQWQCLVSLIFINPQLNTKLFFVIISHGYFSGCLPVDKIAVGDAFWPNNEKKTNMMNCQNAYIWIDVLV